jgi:pimeloyl-ACP methyl ester carboxylesterase
VLLISGIAAPLEVFHDIAHLLGGAGFRVLRFDLYGRGGSTAPQEPQHIDLFVTQILDLLQALPGNTPHQVHVLGFSLGGAIAAKLAEAHPHLVQSLALIAPAGLPRPGGYFWKWFLTIPLLARAFSIMGRFGLSRVFQREIVDWSRRT